MRKTGNKGMRFLAAAGLSLVFCQTVLADSPGVPAGSQSEAVYTAVDGNQVSEEQLRDSVIEYGELGSLIHANNLTVQEIVKSTKEAKDSYMVARDSLKTEQRDAGTEKEEAEADDDFESYAENAALEAIYKSAAHSYNKVLKKLDTYSSNRSRISLEKQLTGGAQNLMISFYSLEAQKEYLQVMEEWMKVRYENMQLKEEAGMATSQEVLTAFNSWTDLSVSIASVTDGQASLRQSLLSILGVEASEETVLGEIPEVEEDLLSALSLEEDTRQAISNNTEIVSTRNTASNGTTAGIHKKQRTLGELEDKVKIKMQQLYEAVLQAKQEYDAATDGFSSARLNWENAQRKQSLGMLSREEYLQEKAQYAGKQASLSAAKLGLLQALETYRWAVKGIVELD